MLSQAPSSSLKLSRRSACDRCKAYKLKCIREGKASDPCQRCAKADLSCTTTVGQVVDTASSNAERSHEQRKAFARQAQKLAQDDRQRGAGDEVNGSVSRLLPRNPDQSPVTQKVTHYPRLLPRQTAAHQPHAGPLNGMGGGLSNQFCMALENSAFPLVDPILSHEDLDMLIGDYMPHQVHPDQDSFMRLAFDDEQALGPPTNSTFSESIGNYNTSTDLNRTQQVVTPDAPHQPAEAVSNEPYDHHQALLDLQLELIQDQQILNRTAKLPHPPGHNPLKCSMAVQHHPVNRILNHTARFWELLKAMCQPNKSESEDNEMRQTLSSSSTQQITHKDHILLVTVVTTYITLLRSCREVFARIHAGLELATKDPSVSLADASLPKLQFGELEIEKNLQLQVNILIELMSSMLQRIASALQVRSAASIGKATVISSDYCLPFWSNRTAVSLRDMILDEERSQTGNFCLGELMQSVKDILKDHI